MHAAPKSAPRQMDAESRLLALLGRRENSDLSPQSEKSGHSRGCDWLDEIVQTFCYDASWPLWGFEKR